MTIAMYAFLILFFIFSGIHLADSWKDDAAARKKTKPFLLIFLILFYVTAARGKGGTEYHLLLALVTALIDALPVLGTGTVLLPWAVWLLLTGNMPLGVGLVLTYAGVTITHQSIQAKLLGDQLGLHPLATLGAIWLGFRVWGVAGMIVFPLLAVCAQQALSGLTLRLPWMDS